MKHLPTLPPALLLMLALLPMPAGAADRKATAPPLLLKPQASGVYQDNAGASHAWTVGQAHGLTWDGTPYLPVGATFCAGDVDGPADG